MGIYTRGSELRQRFQKRIHFPPQRRGSLCACSCHRYRRRRVGETQRVRDGRAFSQRHRQRRIKRIAGRRCVPDFDPEAGDMRGSRSIVRQATLIA